MARDSTVVDDWSEKPACALLNSVKPTAGFLSTETPVAVRPNRSETYPFIGRAASDRLQAKDADILKYNLGCNMSAVHTIRSPRIFKPLRPNRAVGFGGIPGWLFVGDSSWRAIALKNVKKWSYATAITFRLSVSA